MSEATSGNVEKRKEGKRKLARRYFGRWKQRISNTCHLPEEAISALFIQPHPSDEVVGRSQCVHYVVDRASAVVEGMLAQAEDCRID
jgi:hypothetical protein